MRLLRFRTVLTFLCVLHLVGVAHEAMAFRAGRILGHSAATIYLSPSDYRKHVEGHISLNYPVGQGTPQVHAYQVNTPQRTITVRANHGRPYVHFFENGACWPDQVDCHQSTIPEMDFLPFKGQEFNGPIVATIERGHNYWHFVVKMARNNNVLLAVDLQSFDVVDGIVAVDNAKPTPIAPHAAWPPGLICRKGLVCYERFHRAGVDALTRGIVRWADGSTRKVDDGRMSQEPSVDALHSLGQTRIWKVASEEALPGFRASLGSAIVFMSPRQSQTYKLATSDFLQAFEMAVRKRTRRPGMLTFSGSKDLVAALGKQTTAKSLSTQVIRLEVPEKHQKTKPAKLTSVQSQTGPQRGSPEQEMWMMVRDSTAPEDFEAFIKAFPRSQWIPLARLRMLQLRRK